MKTTKRASVRGKAVASGASPQPDLRQRILTAASTLLSSGGTDAVTTRAVAEAAGVQTPALYRFFRDKSALLDALVEYGFATYLASKPPTPDTGDPIEALRRGWDLHVEFGLSNPALYRLMYAEGHTPSPTASATSERVRHQISRIAAQGKLRLDEKRAAQLLHAASCGIVFTLLSVPDNERDISISAITRDAAFDWFTLAEPVANAQTLNPLAVALKARLNEAATLTPMERGMMGEWLDRMARP